jgi:hypothetical protein
MIPPKLPTATKQSTDCLENEERGESEKYIYDTNRKKGDKDK